MEYVNPEGLRLDGRRPMEMRQLRAEIGVVSKADGSAVFEMGNTKVIAAVYGPREVQNRSQQSNDQALVRCEYSMANFSTGDRMRKPKGDRRSTEISLVIRQTMEACILTNLMPRSQIDIFVQVLQADGGTRSACINAATLALADAGIPMCDLVTSCSAGYLNGTPLLDLNYVEDSAGGPDVTLGILPKLDKVTLLQMDSKLQMDTFENVMQLAIEGCKAVASYIREILLENTKQLESRRGVNNAPTVCKVHSDGLLKTGDAHKGSYINPGFYKLNVLCYDCWIDGVMVICYDCS
ncbi:UNVERIFIED_CONTAM: Exosome complex component RRP41 [Sesamum angustifolium]|uniref:Exosome complex component RRP41 n=1 Tax=Sesamum angustifolium TaxID=2727405 RepID=A0AAW2RHI0_9LAMI